MSTVTRERMPFAFALQNRQAARTLEMAARSAAMVTLSPRTQEDTQLCGAIASLTEESLWLTIEGAPPVVDRILPSTCCDGVLEFGDARYLFATNVLAIRAEQDSCQIELARPDSLEVIQRRRFRRANLHGSSLVRLNTYAGNGNDRDDRSCIGIMLNASVAGLAVRVERASADAVTVGENIEAVFTLARDGEPFVVPGSVRSKTPAGTEGQVVLGMQFQHADDAEYKRLQAALESCS